MKTSKKLDFDQAYAELQTILSDLQGEQVSIEQMREKIIKSNELVQYCKDKLRNISNEIATSINSPDSDKS
jgi:exodeoxyribonuclease VII small subunit